MLMTLVIGGVGFVGLLIGSFLNVVVWRVPRGESIVSPASACPACGTPITPRDNVPVLSWLLLRGRCRSCGDAISSRYPLVELATAVSFGLVALGAVAGLWPWAVTPALLAFAAISISLTLIDLDVHRLPDAIVLPAYPVLAALLALASLLTGEWAALAAALAGAGILFAVYFLIAFLAPRGGMGFGDVKLAGVIGLMLGWFGWAPLIVGAFAAFLVGGLYAIVLLLLRRARRGDGVPFGPWMLVGAWIGIAAGDPIASLYLSAAGLG